MGGRYGNQLLLLRSANHMATKKLYQTVEINLDQPLPEVTKKQWLDRCVFPMGMDDSGNFRSIAERKEESY